MHRHEKILQQIENLYPETVIATGLDEAIIGITERNHQPVAVYDKNIIHQILTTQNGLTHEEAIEYADFNIYCAWVGEGTPIYVDPLIYNTPHTPIPPAHPTEMYEI